MPRFLSILIGITTGVFVLLALTSAPERDLQQSQKAKQKTNSKPLSARRSAVGQEGASGRTEISESDTAENGMDAEDAVDGVPTPERIAMPSLERMITGSGLGLSTIGAEYSLFEYSGESPPAAVVQYQKKIRKENWAVIYRLGRKPPWKKTKFQVFAPLGLAGTLPANITGREIVPFAPPAVSVEWYAKDVSKDEQYPEKRTLGKEILTEFAAQRRVLLEKLIQEVDKLIDRKSGKVYSEGVFCVIENRLFIFSKAEDESVDFRKLVNAAEGIIK